MAIISYLWGQRHYPVPYNVSRILGYMSFGVVAWWACEQLPLEGMTKYGVRAVVFIVYLSAVWRKEKGGVVS